MPQSLSAVYIHLIFSTKESYPYLKDEQLQRDLPLFVDVTQDATALWLNYGLRLAQA